MSGSRILYHGTSERFARDIEKNAIDLSKAKMRTDFGPAFYMTYTKGQAIRWANRAIGRGAVLSFYVFPDDWDSLNIRNLMDASIEEWQNVIYENRINGNDLLKEYDIVIGQMADGNMASLMKLCEAGEITKDQFLAGVSKRFGNQIAFKTEKAVKSLKFLRKEIIS